MKFKMYLEKLQIENRIIAPYGIGILLSIFTSLNIFFLAYVFGEDSYVPAVITYIIIFIALLISIDLLIKTIKNKNKNAFIFFSIGYWLFLYLFLFD